MGATWERSRSFVLDNKPDFFRGRISYQPNRPNKTGITVVFQQERCNPGYFAMTPSLSFSAVLLPDHEVFKVIEEDDPEGLGRLFHDRKASLTDCDIDGRSLLHVSYPNSLLWVMGGL